MRSVFNKPQVSTGPPITPTIAWYDPSDLSSLTVAGGLVSQMNDKSGNGHHVTASGTARPTSGANTINGLNVLTWAGPNNLASAAFTQAQPLTVLAVIRATTLGTNNQFISCGGSTPAMGMINGGKHWFYYATTVVDSGVVADTAAHILDAIFNGASSVLALDGAMISSGSSPGVAGLGAGTGVGFGFTAGDWIGYVGESLWYASALSGPNIAAGRAYLKAKWGTP